MFLGNKQYEISTKDIKKARLSSALQHIATAMDVQHMVVLDQVHGSDGFLVDRVIVDQPFDLYKKQGDFLVTRLKRCALVILTADCVPIILHDNVQQIIGIVHSGWRGSAQGVVVSALRMMQQEGSKLSDIEILFGASAGSCCYEVQFDFIQNFHSFGYASKTFIKRNNTLYFDNKLFLELQVQEFGIPSENIQRLQSDCTICNTEYCSYRREKEQSGRQATVIALR